MDLISIVTTLWRHKWVTLPITFLILLAAVYVLKIEPPTYKANGSVLIVNPPPAPTAEQIAKQPSLKTANSNNPYANLGNLPAVAEVVINLVTAGPAQDELLSEGMNAQSTIALGSDFVGSTPILEFTGVGSTQQEAIKSSNLLAQESVKTLHDIQVSQGVNPFYMIKAITLVQPHTAALAVSSRLRTLIGLLAGGLILLFVGVSIAEAMQQRKVGLQSKQKDQPAGDGGDDDLARGEPAPESYRRPPGDYSRSAPDYSRSAPDYDQNRGYGDGRRPDHDPRLRSY